MEPDLSEFVALSRPKRTTCKVALVAEKLTEADAAALLAAIIASGDGSAPVTVGAVIEWCKQRGHDLAQNSIIHHRSGRCSCEHA